MTTSVKAAIPIPMPIFSPPNKAFFVRRAVKMVGALDKFLELVYELNVIVVLEETRLEETRLEEMRLEEARLEEGGLEEVEWVNCHPLM